MQPEVQPKHEVKPNQRLLFGRWGLAITGLAVLGFVALTPTWASAEGATPLHFTSPLNPPDGQHPHGPNDELHQLLETIVDRDAILAEVLGITEEELQAARENGARLDELIANAGLDKETVREAIKSATDAAIEQAVADGTITQEQADQLLTPPAPPEHGERGRGHDKSGHRPPGGPDGETPEQPGGTIPEPGGTIPDEASNTATTDDSGSSTTANAASSESASSASDDSASNEANNTEAPPQRAERPERDSDAQGQGDGSNGGRRGPRR